MRNTKTVMCLHNINCNLINFVCPVSTPLLLPKLMKSQKNFFDEAPSVEIMGMEEICTIFC
jgi:hypothetical protein